MRFHPYQGLASLAAGFPGKTCRRALYWFLVATLTVLPVSSFGSQPNNLAEQVFSKVSPSIVVVMVGNAAGAISAQGSGVVIHPQTVITNCHVARAGARVQVRSGKRTFAAKVQYADTDHDLCELTVPTLVAPSVVISSVKQLEVGETVFAVGAPEGLDLTLSQGLVSSLRPVGDSSLIQTSAPISPGSSGGGLFDAQGRLIGITAFQMTAGQNLNFALPADWIAGIAGNAKTEQLAAKEKLSSQLHFLLQVVPFEDAKNWTGLVQFARTRIEKAPDDDGAWSSLAEAYGNLGQYKQAVEAEKEAIRLDPDFEEAWKALGVANGRLGDDEEEVKAEKRAVRLKPDDAGAWFYLGVAYSDLGENMQALNAVKESIGIKPDISYSWVVLGATYSKMGQYQQGVEAENEAIHLMPNNVSAWSVLGVDYCSEGDRHSALKVYSALKRLDPDRAEELFNNCIVPK